ncbi:hypothetical protein C3L33_14837, partial [Rhododendron williamsianum]
MYSKGLCIPQRTYPFGGRVTVLPGFLDPVPVSLVRLVVSRVVLRLAISASKPQSESQIEIGSASTNAVSDIRGIEIGQIKFKAFDLGGHQIARRVWKDYYAQVDAVVYLVDAYDKERFAESKKELDALLSDESLGNVPFLILGNKIDIPYAASEDELRHYLGLTGLTTGKGKVNLADSNVRPLEVFMCSIVRKMGYGDGFKWMSQYIK